MKYPVIRSLLSVCFIVGAVGALAPAPAGAQGLDQLKGMIGGGDKEGGSALSSLGSMSSGSMGNAAGVIEYCMKNNYLGGGATGVKDQLMSKLGGGSAPAAQKDTGYLSGAKGLLTSSDGKSVDLTGGGLKASLTKQVCEKVLDQAKGML